MGSGLATSKQVKSFVLYERVSYGNIPRLRRISGKLVLPASVGGVKEHFQDKSINSFEILDKRSYVLDDNGEFIFEKKNGDNPTIDNIVSAHSFKTVDRRPESEKNKPYVISIRTNFIEGCIKGDFYKVPPIFDQVTGKREDLEILRQYLLGNRFIALYGFKHHNLDKFFKEKSPYAHRYRNELRVFRRYRKPHCIIINTRAITHYGFKKR